MPHPIFVTGPQRSGTTIAARILASELNRTYIDESQYHPDTLTPDAVVQAPLLFKVVIELSYKHPGAHFVFMHRDKQEIVDSMERIEWYKDYVDHPDFYSNYVDSVYNTLNAYKLTLAEDRWTDMEYDSLSSHPLFIHDRKTFTTRQWQKDKPVGPATWRNDKCTESYSIRLQNVSAGSVAAT
jgi:hypothetical protein